MGTSVWQLREDNEVLKLSGEWYHNGRATFQFDEAGPLVTGKWEYQTMSRVGVTFWDST